MNYKITNLAHFTSLTKHPISSIKKNKYLTSFPSPKNSSKKYSNNIQSPPKDIELNLIRKKFLHKSKHTKSSSSYLNFASPINNMKLNKQSKLENTIKSQLILTSMDNSSIVYSKDKIYSYINDSNYHSNYKNNSLNNKSISINVKKKIDNGNHSHYNNLNYNGKHHKKQFSFTTINSRKSSNEKKYNIDKDINIFNLKNSKANPISLSSKNIYKKQNSKKSINTSNNNITYHNSLKNIFNQNIKFYNNQNFNHKFSINFLANYLKEKKNKIKNSNNQTLNGNENNNSSNPIIKNNKNNSSSSKI